MAAISAPAEARRWLYATLVAASVAGTRVYNHPAPIGAGEPYVTVDALGGPGELKAQRRADDRIWGVYRYRVTAGARTDSLVSLADEAAAVYAALHGQAGTTANARIVWCEHERDVEQTTIEGGVRYERLGGDYLVSVQPL